MPESAESKAISPIERGFQDPRIEGIIARLENQPQIIDHLRKAVNTPFNEATTLCVRTEDLVTVLHAICSSETLPTGDSEHGKSLFTKASGWYYATPNYRADFFTKNPAVKSNNPLYDLSINHLLGRNYSSYRFVPWITAFNQSIEPLLKNDWWAEAEKIIRDRNSNIFHPSSSEKIPIPLIREAFCRDMFTEIETTIKNHNNGFRAKILDSNDYLCKRIFDWTKEKLTANQGLDIISYLFQTLGLRQGVIIGFSEEILSGRDFVTDATARDDILHGQHEMAIYAPWGITHPLDAIQSIYPVGLYEAKVLMDLGVLR